MQLASLVSQYLTAFKANTRPNSYPVTAKLSGRYSGAAHRMPATRTTAITDKRPTMSMILTFRIE